MTLVAASRLLGIVLATTMGVVPLAPPEHLHEAEEHGHHELLVHRHAQPHSAAHHGTSHHADGHDGVLDDDDASVLTVSASVTLPLSPIRASAAPPAVPWFPPPPLVARAHGPICIDDPLIHGPPRAPASPRAPPLSLA
jgi:hypothetical protein